MAKPEKMPQVGDLVIYCHGDPNVIGGETNDLPAIVVQVSDDGRVAGQAFLPPGTMLNTPTGSMPVATMPIVASYDAKPRAATWRWRDAGKPAANVVGLH
jgi:hypothetical protein